MEEHLQAKVHLHMEGEQVVMQKCIFLKNILEKQYIFTIYHEPFIKIILRNPIN